MTHLILSPSLVARLADAWGYFVASTNTATFIAVGTGESDKRTVEQRSALVERVELASDRLIAELNAKIVAQHPDVPDARHFYWKASEALTKKRWAELKRKSDARKARLLELEAERESVRELIAA